MKNTELCYRKLIEACGECNQREEAFKLFYDLKKCSIELSIETFNIYFKACSESLYTKAEEIKQPKTPKKQKLMNIIQKAVIELTTNCPNCNRYIREEDVIASYPKDLDTYQISCSCGKQFIPKLEVYLSKDEVETYIFLSPHLFSKETTNLINNAKSSNVFFTVFVYTNG